MLIQIAVGGMILIGALVYYMRATKQVSKQRTASRQLVTAELLAQELSEAFRSLESGATLRNYFQTNPVNGTLSPYLLCAHINVLDRNNNSVLNPDPRADLAASTLDGGSPKLRANRYYQIQVIDLNSMTVDPSFCGKKITDPPALSANQRYLISVGVSWVPKEAGLADLKTVSLATLLPL